MGRATLSERWAALAGPTRRPIGASLASTLCPGRLAAVGVPRKGEPAMTHPRTVRWFCLALAILGARPGFAQGLRVPGRGGGALNAPIATRPGPRLGRE